MQTSVNNAIATNFPAALTSLEENFSAVQAAEKAFAQVQNLSLFSVI